jgi:hypothetical protein
MTFEFDVSIRFEAKNKEQALQYADKIMKLLEHGSPADSLRDLDIEARFVEAKNIRKA